MHRTLCVRVAASGEEAVVMRAAHAPAFLSRPVLARYHMPLLSRGATSCTRSPPPRHLPELPPPR